ncbi:MAG: conjugal transfer protein TraQ [Ottowia sp.]|nr:conjugal transfer protein TraQ [Ottowia sp.]
MDLAQMIIRFANEFSVAMWRLLWVLGAVVGISYVGSSLMRMQRASRFPGHSPVTFGDILPVILVGALLLNLSRSINVAWNTFGTGVVTYGPISYGGVADFGRLAEAVNAALTIASVAGGFFFFKGCLLLKKPWMDGQSSHGAEDYVWKAITHMLGGSALVQITQMIEAFRHSLKLFW